MENCFLYKVERNAKLTAQLSVYKKKTPSYQPVNSELSGNVYTQVWDKCKFQTATQAQTVTLHFLWSRHIRGALIKAGVSTDPSLFQNHLEAALTTYQPELHITIFFLVCKVPPPPHHHHLQCLSDIKAAHENMEEGNYRMILLWLQQHSSCHDKQAHV